MSRFKNAVERMMKQEDKGTRFSIAVPLFNHADFLAFTIDSVLAQDFQHFELLISDNASTDGSDVIAQKADGDRVTFRRNKTNIGFAANLDRAVALGSAPFVILVSSDDRMASQALSVYARLLDAVEDSERVIIASAIWLIDERGAITGRSGMDRRMWKGAVIDRELSELAGSKVWSVNADQLLRESVLHFRTPAAFVSTCFPRIVWEAIGGYRGARIANPDKWFFWRALTEVDKVLFVDEPLFEYRRHKINIDKSRDVALSLTQAVDDYCSYLEMPESMLQFASLQRSQVETAFITEAILKRAATFGAGGRRKEAIAYRRFSSAVARRGLWRNVWWWGALLLSFPGVHRLLPRQLMERQVGNSVLHNLESVVAR